MENTFADLELINKLIFQTCGLEFSHFEADIESQDYAACKFQLNSQKTRFRKAKITPAKTGQFVTIWKRNEKRITQPFDFTDDFDFFIIATREQNHFGIFIFTKSVLLENKILSDKTEQGKRGIRVYANWELTTNKQAQKTQQWQTKYFLEIFQDKSIDINKAKQLFKIED